jgi:hypothetical protein
MTLSNKQEDAIWQIKTIEGQLGVRWFVQEELKDITLHTMKALVKKGYLETLSLGSHIYYRLIRASSTTPHFFDDKVKSCVKK